MLKSMNRTPPLGKPRFKKDAPVYKNWEKKDPINKKFSSIRFGTEIKDLNLLTEVTYNDIVELMGVFDKINAIELYINENIVPTLNDHDERITNIDNHYLPKDSFVNPIEEIRNYTFEDTEEVTRGLQLLVDAFVNALTPVPPNDEGEKTNTETAFANLGRELRNEKLAKRAKKRAEATAEPTADNK